MRLTILSTYPPRPCGIAVFSSDLRSAIVETASRNAVDIVSIVRNPGQSHPPEVIATIRQDVLSDYAAAARVVMSRGADVVLIEHEYGIFGGDSGAFVLNFVKELTVPVVVTLHTVLSDPSPHQVRILRQLCDQATLVTVFTETARRMVTEARLVDPERVRVVPHGAPDLLALASESRPEPETPDRSRWYRSAGPASERDLTLRQLRNRTVLSTFGLISSSKGLEVAIQALPRVVARHPNVVYLIAGQTHPEVIKHEGESYRLRLERLVRDLHLADHVLFLDHFLTVEELAVLLGQTDLYLTPYRSREQIVSGALSFAVAAGCPVVSTPYFYAEDLLGSGAGVLVPFGDSAKLGDAVIDFLDSPAKLATARKEASRVGAELGWRNVGQTTVEVLAEAVAQNPAGISGRLAALVSSPQILPLHLLTLVDDVGIVQHARGIIPDRSSGYCLDDMARLAIVAMGLEQEFSDPIYKRMLASALAYVVHAWDPTVPGMHNFMDYSRRWLDEPYLGDHVGRAAWALGTVAAAQPLRDEAWPSLRLLIDMLPALQAAQSRREVAFAMLGLTRPAPEALPGAARDVLGELADRLCGWYDEHRRGDWLWFEQTLTYDNARLPQALIAAGHRMENADMMKRGLEALDWYADQCGLHTDTIRLVGNRWRRAGEPPRPWSEEGDEQPLDASALVEALAEASVATGQSEYGEEAVRAFEWFLGRNTPGIAVYDFATGGCHDGLGPDGLNQNEGAESTLAFLQAVLVLAEAGLQAPIPRLP